MKIHNHTKGAWIAQSQPDGSARIVQATSSPTKSNVICENVLPCNVPVIVSAPKLLEKLQALVNAVENAAVHDFVLSAQCQEMINARKFLP